MSEEDISERMNAILNLCEMNPDAGLELIEQAIKKKNTTGAESIYKVCKGNCIW